jgi:DNA-binding response OmpR family regulator
MLAEKSRRLVDLAERLSEAIMTAAICADEIRIVAQAEFAGHELTVGARPQRRAYADLPMSRAWVDASTFSVIWAGKACRLRRTILFRLAARLTRQPNQYISTDELLRDVWEGGLRSPETIRSTVRHLRGRLSGAGMNDLAAAIRSTGGCYGLIFDGKQ